MVQNESSSKYYLVLVVIVVVVAIVSLLMINRNKVSNVLVTDNVLEADNFEAADLTGQPTKVINKKLLSCPQKIILPSGIPNGFDPSKILPPDKKGPIKQTKGKTYCNSNNVCTTFDSEPVYYDQKGLPLNFAWTNPNWKSNSDSKNTVLTLTSADFDSSVHNGVFYCYYSADIGFVNMYLVENYEESKEYGYSAKDLIEMNPSIWTYGEYHGVKNCKKTKKLAVWSCDKIKK